MLKENLETDFLCTEYLVYDAIKATKHIHLVGQFHQGITFR